MKKLLLILLMFSCSLVALPSLNDFLKKDLTTIEYAISQSDFRTVMELVKKNVKDDDLDHYLQLSQNSMGNPPVSSIYNKATGFFCLACSMALVYSTFDFFKNEIVAASPRLSERYKSVHNVIMDFGRLSGFVSSYLIADLGFKKIDPRSSYKKQLLINLYLKNLKAN
jgi:hypothetical protein